MLGFAVIQQMSHSFEQDLKKRIPQPLKHNLNTIGSGQLAGTPAGRSSMSVDEGTNTHVATLPFKKGKEIFVDVRNVTNPQRELFKRCKSIA